MKRSIAVASFLLWTGVILSTYYVVQKPVLLNAFTGLAGTFWTLLLAVALLFSAHGLGSRALGWLGWRSPDESERLLLVMGTGLGGLGLVGLAVSAARLAHTPVFLVILMFLIPFFLIRGDLSKLLIDLKAFATLWNLSVSQYNFLTKLGLSLLLALAFTLTLAPQFEAFDALLYHLEQPARVLHDGGLRRINIPHFWFPNLTENLYLWALALGSERLAQIMHLTWGLLSALLLWRWAVKVWGTDIGCKTLLLVAAIPSLPMLTAWAYADLALAFYAIASLYALAHFESGRSAGWLRVGGVMAGLAMTVKYTSFTLPLTGVLLLLLWRRSSFPQAIRAAAQFSLIALVTAVPWYVRNAAVMGNPFYPFAFGGLYWDSFRADWYTSAGTGIGRDVLQLLLLPLNATLGHRDANFFDGRTGPLFLLLAPFTIWVLLRSAHEDSDRSRSLQAIGSFCAVSFAAWTLGVINTSALWQARLLLPALLALTVPTALGWNAIQALNSSKFRVGFLANVLIGLVIGLTVFDNIAFVVQRNPIAFAFGAQSRQGYIERVNPGYAGLMQSLENLPPDAYLYSLFEPRSYGLPRKIQPDPINDNFFHDLHLYQTPAAIMEHWKSQGYTHILVYERGLRLIAETGSNEKIPAGTDTLRRLLESLELVQETPDGAYSIYAIP